MEDDKEIKELAPARKGNPEWVKGKSGNPSGMDSRLVKLTRKCKLYSVRGAEVCREIMEDTTKSPFARLQAVSLLWDRGHGKARETLDVNANVTVGTTWTSIVAEAYRVRDERKAKEAAIVDAEFKET